LFAAYPGRAPIVSVKFHPCPEGYEPVDGLGSVVCSTPVMSGNKPWLEHDWFPPTPMSTGVTPPGTDAGGTLSFTFDANAGSTTNSVSATNATIARPPA
jgi:hypothetical protein